MYTGLQELRERSIGSPKGLRKHKLARPHLRSRVPSHASSAFVLTSEKFTSINVGKVYQLNNVHCGVG